MFYSGELMFSLKTKVTAACLLLAMGVMLPLSPCSAITIQEEETLSKEFLRAVKAHYPIIHDPIVSQYINRIGNRLLAAFPTTPFKYHFYVIKQDNYNAFAGPGGHVFVNSGLIAAMDSEEELAGILCHEISHVNCRHISKNIERSSKIQTATLAGIVAGILLGIGGGGDAASAVTVGSMAASQSLSLAYSREDERQADKVGLQYLYKAGYTGHGLLSMMKKIRSKQWYGSNEYPSYLMTHPASGERIVYIGNWMETNAPGVEPKPEKPNSDFNRVKMRLIAFYGDEQLALKRFSEQVAAQPEDFFAHYGYGLTLLRTQDRKAAITSLKKALALQAFDPYLRTDLGMACFMDGQYESALKLLDPPTTGIKEIDLERYFYLGRTLMQTDRLEEAKTIFLKLVEMWPSYDKVLYYLGETFGKMEKMDDAHFYLGLHYKARGNFQKARFHLKRGLELATNETQKEKMKAELNRLKKEKKEQAQEKKAFIFRESVPYN